MAKANKLIPVVDGTAGTPIELTDSRIEITNPAANDLLQYDSTQQQFVNTPASSIVPSHRTINHEQITDSSLGDANLHDGFYFPNAVQDYDGNWYGAVVIGDQVWLGENLRTTHYADGTAIPKASTTSSSHAVYLDNSSSPIPLEKRGYHYNYLAFSRDDDGPEISSMTQGIAPNGWHIPTYNETQILKSYLNRQNRHKYNNTADYIAKSIASTDYWGTSETVGAVGYDKGSNNSSGFNAFPCGATASNSFSSNMTAIWSGRNATVGLKPMTISDSSTTITTTTLYGSIWACSVRCVSDLTPVQFRDWYVKTYGTLQHNVLSSELSAGRDIAITPQSQYVPKGFEELEYIRSTGTEWLDTYVVLGRDNTVSIKIVAQGEGDKGLICGFDQDWGGSYLGDNGSKYYMTGLSPSDERNTSNSLLKATLSETWTSTSSQYTLSGYIDDVPNTVYTSPRMNNINSNILLFRANNWTTADSYWAGRIFECKIWKNGKLVRNFVPARRILDNVVGLYETVHEEFYTNRGTGTLRAGPIVAIGAKTIISYTGIEIPNLTNNSGKVLTVNNTEDNVEWKKLDSIEDLSNVEIDNTPVDFKYIPDAVTDYDGNSYGAVVIGNKVWMAENLRTTHYADGTAIALGTGNTSTPSYFNNTSSSIPLEKRGYLYNYYGVTKGTNGSSTNPSNFQGVAPNGWHVPSDAEFLETENYISAYLGGSQISSENDIFDGRFTDVAIAKSIASKDYWQSSDVSNAPGNNPNINNSCWLGLTPNGNVINGLYSYVGQRCYLWTCTSASNKYIRRSINYAYAGIYRYNTSDAVAGYNVRCVYNGTPQQFMDEMYSKLMDKQILVYDKTKNAFVNKKIAEALPSMSGNSGKVLAVNSGETGVEWVTQSGGGDAGVLYCTLTHSGSTYTCDTSVSDIVTAYQSGKVVLLKITTDYRVFTCVHARTLSGTTTINAFYTGGVTASNSGMTDASITLLRYVGSEWQLLNSWNIQQKLVGTQTTGQNLKTVNGNSLLGSGDLTIGGGTEELLMCTFTGSTTVTCDKTIVQIYDAYQNEKCIIGIRGNELYNLSYCTSTIATFYSVNSPNTNNPILYAISTSDSGATWTKTEFGIQKQLVSGTNIRTINNISLLSAGNLTIPAPTINTRYNPYSISADGSTSFGLNGNREYSRMQFADGVTTYGFTFTVSDENKNYDRFVLLDNTNNTKDVTITINSVQIATNNVYSDCDNIFKPRPLVVKAGSFVELTVKILKSDVGATTGIVTLNNNISRYVTIYSGSTAPSSSTGSNGDIYIQTVS